MLGWVAVTNKFSIETGILFMIQFFWQFPHFWAIGWVSYDDYERAGFKMLPTGKRDNSTAFQIVFYTIWMILVSTLPYFSFTGTFTIGFPSLILILVALWLLSLMFGEKMYHHYIFLMSFLCTYISRMQNYLILRLQL